MPSLLVTDLWNMENEVQSQADQADLSADQSDKAADADYQINKLTLKQYCQIQLYNENGLEE